MEGVGRRFVDRAAGADAAALMRSLQGAPVRSLFAPAGIEPAPSRKGRAP